MAHRQQHLSILLAHRAMIEEASKEPRPSIDVSKNSRLATRRLKSSQSKGQQQGISDMGAGRRGGKQHSKEQSDRHELVTAHASALTACRCCWPQVRLSADRPQGFLQQRITHPGLKRLQGPRASVSGSRRSLSLYGFTTAQIGNYTAFTNPLVQNWPSYWHVLLQ